MYGAYNLCTVQIRMRWRCQSAAAAATLSGEMSFEGGSEFDEDMRNINAAEGDRQRVSE